MSRSTQRGTNGRDYCNGQFVPDPLSRTGIAELLRAAAAGYAIDGEDPARVARIRKSARILEGRERPGDARRHRKGAV